MKKRNYALIFMPLAIAVSIVIGIFIGKHLNFGDARQLGRSKLSTILSMIDQNYVDSINVNDLIELALPDIMAQLDPHSAYIAKKDFEAANSDLEGSFSGVGISFQILNDSVTVVEVITGGPAEKVGILAGDRIISANGKNLTGPDITTDDVFNNLRGEKGTKVKLKIKRSNSTKANVFDVIRGDIPINSVDAHYMLDKEIGYIKVGKFSRTTYNEFITSLGELKRKGANNFVVDLRGNSGGYMDQAIMMVNEFLPEGRTIVFTKGRCMPDNNISYSDGNGSFQNAGLSVLIDEYSASASEIFAGAIQDNDRGLIVGRRSFGKGLVQNQLMLPDSSAIRLTVARYYTPSGRCIQKEYTRGKDGKYQQDIVDRYTHGEFYNADSIKLDKSKVYHTVNGRTVYGGGGIMPDLFVPEDTTGITSYYINVVNAGLIPKFAFDVADHYRDLLKKTKTAEDVLRIIPREETLLKNFVRFAVSNQIPARWYYIRQSSVRLMRQIKASIVRDAVGYNEFYKIFNQDDVVISTAIDSFKTKKYKTLLTK